MDVDFRGPSRYDTKGGGPEVSFPGLGASSVVLREANRTVDYYKLEVEETDVAVTPANKSYI